MKRKQSSTAFGAAIQLSENKKVETILKCVLNKQDGCSLKYFLSKGRSATAVLKQRVSVSVELSPMVCTLNISALPMTSLINLTFRSTLHFSTKFICFWETVMLNAECRC